MTSIVAAYARQRLADMEQLSAELGRHRHGQPPRRPADRQPATRSWLLRLLQPMRTRSIRAAAPASSGHLRTGHRSPSGVPGR